MELFLSRLAHGEIDILSSLEAPSRRGRPPKDEPMVVREERQSLTARTGTENFGQELIYVAGVNNRFVSKRIGEVIRCVMLRLSCERSKVIPQAHVSSMERSSYAQKS